MKNIVIFAIKRDILIKIVIINNNHINTNNTTNNLTNNIANNIAGSLIYLYDYFMEGQKIYDRVKL